MIKLDKDYSDYVDMTDPNYPHGKAKNASSSESFDGTPVVADLLNDIVGAHQAMFKKAYGDSEQISGTPDSVNDSQFAEAVAKYVFDKIKEHVNKRGLTDNVHGATPNAEPGQIACRDELGNLQVSDAVENGDAVNLKLLSELSDVVDGKSPKAGSSELTTFSGGTFGAAAARGVDAAITAGSANLPTSGAVNNALANKANKSDLTQYNFARDHVGGISTVSYIDVLPHADNGNQRTRLNLVANNGRLVINHFNSSGVNDWNTETLITGDFANIMTVPNWSGSVLQPIEQWHTASTRGWVIASSQAPYTNNDRLFIATDKNNPDNNPISITIFYNDYNGNTWGSSICVPVKTGDMYKAKIENGTLRFVPCS